MSRLPEHLPAEHLPEHSLEVSREINDRWRGAVGGNLVADGPPAQRFNPLTEMWFVMQTAAVLLFLLVVTTEMYRRFQTLLLAQPRQTTEAAIVGFATLISGALFIFVALGFVIGEFKYLKRNRV